MLYAFDEFELDARTPELTSGGEPVKVDAAVLRLLLTLVRQAGQVVSKRDLIAEVWDDRAVSDNVITVTMVRLRKALGHRRGEREFVVNVHGRGYRFARQVHARQADAAPLLTVTAPDAKGPPFVGRERVLEQMRALLQQARGGRGGACLLSGEPGIGKTRAVEVLEREAIAAGLLVAWGCCREEGDAPPLSPCIALARAVIARVGYAALASELGSATEELVALMPELGSDPARREKSGLRPGFAHNGAARHAIVSALARLFTLVSLRIPCVLVLDDLHRADDASLEFLRHFIDEIAHSRVLLLGTLRDPWEGLAPRARADLTLVLGHRNCERVALGRLSEADVVAYVGALIEDEGQELGRAVYQKSEGNPFFMVELAHQLRRADKPDPKLLAVPGAALDLMRQRVALLDGAARGVLSCAAVIGREFELSVLKVASQVEPNALIESLDRAVAGEVVRPLAESRTRFAFGHELLRAALYQALEPALRRELHLRVAKALEQRAESGESVPPAELAYHYYAALPASDLRKTVQVCMDAGWAAAAVHANADVVRHLGHALEALDLMPDPSPRLRMGLLLPRAMFARFDAPADFERMIAEIIRIARRQPGPLLGYAALLISPDAGFPPLMRSLDTLEDALQLLPKEAPELRAALLARLALGAPYAFERAQCERMIAEGFELVTANRRALLARYNLLAAKLYLRGGPAHEAEARELSSAIEQICREHPATMTVPPPLLDVHRAILALQAGDPKALAGALERASARAQRIRHRELSWHVERFALMARINQGELPLVRAELTALHGRAERDSIPGVALLKLHDLGVVLGERPRWPDDMPVIEPDDAPNMWALRLRALIACGQLEQARGTLRAVTPERLAQLPCDRDYLGTLGSLVRVALELGADAYFEPLYALLAPYPERFAAHFGFLCEGSVSQLLGMLARARGQTREARAHFECALELCERAGMKPRAEETRSSLALSSPPHPN